MNRTCLWGSRPSTFFLDEIHGHKELSVCPRSRGAIDRRGRYSKVWRSRWVFFRRRASSNPSCVSVAISEYGDLASRYTTRSNKLIRLQAWLFKYDYIIDSGSRECQERPRKTDPPRTPHHVSDPRSNPSLTRVAVKRTANSISQARRLNRAIHRARSADSFMSLDL